MLAEIDLSSSDTSAVGGGDGLDYGAYSHEEYTV